MLITSLGLYPIMPVVVTLLQVHRGEIAQQIDSDKFMSSKVLTLSVWSCAQDSIRKSGYCQFVFVLAILLDLGLFSRSFAQI